MIRIIALLIMSTSFLMAQIQVLQPSVAATDDPLAIRYNPAGLGFNNHTENMLMTHFDGSEFTKDFAYYSQSKTTGFGYQWDVLSATNIWSFSQGIKLSRSQSMGFTYSFDDSHWLEGRYDLGWMHRPFPMLALGAQIQNVWSGSNDAMTLTSGVAFQNRTGRLGGGIDMSITEGNSDLDGFLTGFIEPIKGVRLNVYSDLGSDNYGVSLGISMPKMGLESHGNSSSFSAQTLVLRATENPYRTIFGEKSIKKDSQTYLRIKLDGLLIEEPEVKRPNFPFKLDLNIPFLGGQVVYGKQLRKFVDQMQEYTDDPNIHGLIIDLESFRGGFSKITEARWAFQRFHDAGKRIIVYSKFGLGNSSTYLLSMADEIYTHEMAGVDLRGLAMEITFFRGLLDTLSVVPEVWRVSPFKTAADPYLQHSMSDAMRTNYTQLLDGIYSEFVDGISLGKGWDNEHTREVINNGPYLLTADAIEAGLLTGTMYPDEFDEYVKALNDGKITIIKPSRKEENPEYQYAWRHDKVNDKIAVIYAVGNIVSGKSKPGPSGSKTMGDETIAEAIKQAREDESIKAIVLRIDSGGGSALASDIMWREILQATESDSSNVKPVIASMSDVAASGGYYIACQADSIIAYPSTITGSIGVTGMRLNISQLKERFGIHTDRLIRGDHADFVSGNRLASEVENNMILASIDDTYIKFKERVLKGRDALENIKDLDSLALGRVWTGVDAKGYGLIDEVGGYYDAIDLAKSAAGLTGEVDIVEMPFYKTKTDLKKLMGGEASIDLVSSQVLESINVMDILPIIEGGEIQMIMPVKIEIK